MTTGSYGMVKIADHSRPTVLFYQLTGNIDFQSPLSSDSHTPKPCLSAKIQSPLLRPAQEYGLRYIIHRYWQVRVNDNGTLNPPMFCVPVRAIVSPHNPKSGTIAVPASTLNWSASSRFVCMTHKHIVHAALFR